MVELLLDRGADPDQRDEDGSKPSLLAHLAGREDLVERLGGLDGAGRPSVLAAFATGDVPELTTALSAGADPDENDEAGDTALMHLAALGDLDRVEILLDAGADLVAQNHKGETAIHTALSQPDPETRMLVAGEIVMRASEEGDLTELLSRRDADGRSGAVLFGARLAEGVDPGSALARQEGPIIEREIPEKRRSWRRSLRWIQTGSRRSLPRSRWAILLQFG